MRYVPPFAALKTWITRHAAADNTRLAPAYDDVLDVLKKFLEAVPVDEDWYMAEYPAICRFVERTPTESVASHFHKHGYFEGRRPFAPGWHDLTEPVPFAQSYDRLRIVPMLGRLRVDIARDDFLALIKNILVAVPVDDPWYCAAYPKAAKKIDNGTYSSAAEHYVERGYFDGCLPFDIIVDEEWYISRYSHVKTGLEHGVATSGRDHFMRVGYSEGCRPAPP
jgi:hypothetical protein